MINVLRRILVFAIGSGAILFGTNSVSAQSGTVNAPSILNQDYAVQPFAAQAFSGQTQVSQPYMGTPMTQIVPNGVPYGVPNGVPNGVVGQMMPGVQPFMMGPPIAPPPIAPPPAEPMIVEQAVTELTGEDPPIQPVWYNPMTWIGPWWNGSVSLGINGSDGNANTFNIRSGFELSRETERTNWDLNLNYNKNTANDLETAHNALLQSNWDYKLRNPRWTWFNKLGLEYDEFKNFDLRLFTNSGIGYTFIDNEITQFRGRFGSGVSREFGGVDDDWKPEAAFGIDFARQMTERQRFVATVDYYPAWEDFSDYRLVSDFGWEIDLDAPTNLSLKFSVIDRYDSTPNGALANDVDYSVLLIWTL